MNEPKPGMQHPHLIRIVRLTLSPEYVADFKTLFSEVKDRIRASAGCLHLELLVDATYPNIMTTYSIWQHAAALDAYRNSELFSVTWKRTRTMFAAPPLAFSSFQVDIQ